MAKVYKDENGHFTSKENDGGPCYHKVGRSGNKYQAITEDGKREDISNEDYKALKDMHVEDEDFDEELDSDFESENEYMKGQIFYDGEHAYKITDINDEEVEFIDESGSKRVAPLAEFKGMVESDEFDTHGITMEEAQKLGLDLDNWEAIDKERQKRYKRVDKVLENMVGPYGFENGVAKLKKMGINVPKEVGYLNMDEDGILEGYDENDDLLWKYDVNNQTEVHLSQSLTEDDKLPVPSEEQRQEIRDESAPDEKESHQIAQEQEERNQRKQRIADTLSQAKQLKTFKEVNDLLSKLPQDEADEIWAELVKGINK